METFSVSLAICAGNLLVSGEFPTQRPVTWSFDVFFDLHPNKLLGKEWWGWSFETPSFPLWRHCNANLILYVASSANTSHFKWLMLVKCLLTVVIMGQANGFSPDRPDTILYFLPTEPLRTQFSEIICKIQQFSYKNNSKCRLQISGHFISVGMC